MDHDQNFKNLIVDYPREGLTFFAAEEAKGIEGAWVVPVRQEQLKKRLGEPGAPVVAATRARVEKSV